VGADADLPAQTLTYSLVTGPGSVAGNEWTWTPGEADGPGTYTVTVQVSDGTASAQQSFDVTVAEVNQAPTLDDPADGSVDELVLTSRTLVGADADLPAQTLTYSLVSGPGAVTGDVWSWTPGETDGPGTFTVTVKVSDGTAEAQQSFDITVNEVNQAPTLEDPADGSVDELVAISRTLVGADADLPAQTLTFSLVTGPGSVAGNEWSWTPGETDGPGTFTVTVKVSDGTAEAQQSFDITVAEVNQAPTLADPADGSVDELVAISRTLVGADADLPAQTLTYSLVSGPGSVAGNEWSWTPGETDGPGTFTVTVKVSDGTAEAQQSFDITVNEVNQAPTLEDPADGSVDELVAISRTLVGADADLPAQILTYSVVSGPGSVTGNEWSWTPGEADGPGTYTVTVKVSDGTADAQQSFDVTVNEVNQAPTLDDPADGSVDELVAISRTLVGADADLPAQTLTYSLVTGPGSVAGNEWTWTPGEVDGPGTFTVTVKVSDGTAEAQQSFDITVNEVNQAPALEDPADGTVDELVAISRTLVGADADLPAQILTYSVVSGPGSVTGNGLGGGQRVVLDSGRDRRPRHLHRHRAGQRRNRECSTELRHHGQRSQPGSDAGRPGRWHRR